MPTFEDYQFAVHAILEATTARERTRALQESHVQAIHAYHARLGQRIRAQAASGAVDKRTQGF